MDYIKTDAADRSRRREGGTLANTGHSLTEKTAVYYIPVVPPDASTNNR